MTLTPPMIRLQSRLKMRHMTLLSLLGATPNIRRVAREMNISQPSASALLREVEDALECELFIREVHGLKATPFGVAMIEWATIILADLERASSDLAAIALGTGSRIRVGISPLAAPRLFPRAVELFRADSPEATIAVQTGIEGTLIPLFLNGELDCAIVRMVPELKHSSVDYEVLYNEAANVVVRQGHPLTGKTAIAADEIDRFQWILPVSKGPPYDVVGAALMAQGARLPKVVIETWSAIVIVHLLQTSDLMAVLPHSLAEHYQHTLQILPLYLPDLLYPVVLLSRPRPATDVFFERFMTAVRQAARDTAPLRQPGRLSANPISP
jgi:DNA-binding transcriptional LysR family regulator